MFCLFLGMSMPAFAQERTSKFIVNLETSPGVGYRSLVNSTNNAVIEDIINTRNSQEQPLQNISFGITAGLQLSPSSELAIGVRYATKGYQYGMDIVFADSMDPLAPESIRVVTRARFIEIPVQYTHSIYSADRKFFVTPEIYWNRLINSAHISYKKFDDRREKDKQIHDPTNGTISFLGVGIQMGVEKAFSDKFSLRVAPGFRADVIDIATDPLMLFHWNAGLNITGRFKW